MNRERQGLLYNHEKNPLDVAVIGLGNIGSHTALALARLGARRIALYDPDSVEEHNLSSQAYSLIDIGKPKVSAIAEGILGIDGGIETMGEFNTFEGRCVQGDPIGDVLVVAVDTLEARRSIADAMLELPADNRPRLIIDGRVGGSQVEVHCYQTPEGWRADIPAQSDADPCGGRYICYSSLGIAAFIANTAKRFLMGQSIYGRVQFHYDTLDIVKGRRIVFGNGNNAAG